MTRHALDCALCCGLAACDCGAESKPRYRVLRPKYEKTGETLLTLEGLIKWERVQFVQIGTAESMEDAYAKYPRGYWKGFSHVLEEIK